MIYSLSGTVKETHSDFIVIETHGVGYQVFVSEITLSQISSQEKTTTLYIYHHIREDTQLLFGFLSLEERQFFTVLTSVSGVGPKLGIKILSYISVTQFTQAVLSEDLSVLTSILSLIHI